MRHIQITAEAVHRVESNRGFCDALGRATTGVLRSRVGLDPRYLQLKSLSLAEGQPALLSMDVWANKGLQRIGIELFKPDGGSNITGLDTLGKAFHIRKAQLIRSAGGL